MRKLCLVCLFVAGCAPDISVDPGQGPGELPPIDGPTTEFDPAASVIPFPNQLLIDPSTGHVALPPQCGETPAQTALREQVLNHLDGFGTYEAAMQVTFTAPVEMSSLTNHVHLYRIAPADPNEIPVVLVPGTTVRASADCSSSQTVDNLTIVPAVPLDGASTFVVALTSGITDANGDPFLPSVTWSLVRQATDPVTVNGGTIVSERTPFDPVTDRDRLLGLDLLWKAHAQALTFLDSALGAPRDDLLIAWVLHTQTTTRPLDPTVSGSLAAALPKTPLTDVASITGGDTEAYLKAVLGEATCTQVGCTAVGDVVSATLTVPRYQTDTTNPLAGGDPVPGPWSDPITPSKTGTDALSVLAFVPASQMPTGGYPVVIFGHGLTRSSSDLYAIGSQLAAAGMASVAIDWVDHGSRAVQVSDSAAIGCDGTPAPSAAPQCFAPIVSADLAATRDNLRESALDALGLVDALGACGINDCGPLKVDGDRIGYMGQSLGSIIGANVVAMSSRIQAAVLNVGGVGLLDIVENTASAGIRCPLVDALINAGVIDGVPLTPPPTPSDATCLTDSWKAQPSYRQFASIARWVLDPADGANYVARLASRSVLVQEVIDDAVVPNIATANLAKLDGLTAAAADVATAPVKPLTMITSNPTQPKWVQYSTLPAGSGFPGNTYEHGSLLAPAGTGADGALATAQLQADAITYLVNNLGIAD